MNNNRAIAEETNYLFNVDFFDDNFDPDGNEEHLVRAEKMLDSYPWSDIFYAWNEYLHTKCKTPEEVYNYCNLFMYYGGTDQFIPNPYEFLGYIYYMIDLNTYWDMAGELLDEMSISILEKSGEISTWNDPYYQSWKDPKILEEIDKYKSMQKE